MESLAICEHIVVIELMERAFCRLDLLEGMTLEEHLIDEISEIQRDLLKAKDPQRDVAERVDLIVADVMDAFDEPKPAA